MPSSSALVSAVLSLHLAAPPGDEPPARAISVIAFNVLYDASDAGVAQSITAIDDADADVVCLTELTPRFAVAFEKRLGREYPHRALRPKSGTWGVGIASRTPLSSPVVFAQKPHRIPAMDARVVLGERELVVACLHLFPPLGIHKRGDGVLDTMDKNVELRRQQAEHLVQRYAREKGPLVIMGDMNEGRDGKALATFDRAGLAHACAAEGRDCGATFPGGISRLPAVFEIDHILGRGVRFRAARVIRAGGSDHFPVFAELEPLWP